PVLATRRYYVEPDGRRGRQSTQRCFARASPTWIARFLSPPAARICIWSVVSAMALWRPKSTNPLLQSEVSPHQEGDLRSSSNLKQYRTFIALGPTARMS